jgi:DNA-nicking Smr family endonuclease
VSAPSKRPVGPPHPIEPGRRRQLERNPRHLVAEVDLHGHNETSARDLMTRFILARHAEGGRSVLVVTGKGALGDGVLRRRAPDWLAQPPLREIVAGVSEAHRRHGGEGALYVALKRRARA